MERSIRNSARSHLMLQVAKSPWQDGGQSQCFTQGLCILCFTLNLQIAKNVGNQALGGGKNPAWIHRLKECHKSNTTSSISKIGPSSSEATFLGQVNPKTTCANKPTSAFPKHAATAPSIALSQAMIPLLGLGEKECEMDHPFFPTNGVAIDLQGK